MTSCAAHIFIDGVRVFCTLNHEGAASKIETIHSIENATWVAEVTRCQNAKLFGNGNVVVCVKRYHHDGVCSFLEETDTRRAVPNLDGMFTPTSCAHVWDEKAGKYVLVLKFLDKYKVIRDVRGKLNADALFALPQKFELSDPRSATDIAYDALREYVNEDRAGVGRVLLGEPPKSFHERLVEECAKLGPFLVGKNEAYGDSTRVISRMLAEFYPNGIPVAQIENAYYIIQVLNKLKRVATDNDPTGESPWLDSAGYSVLAYVKRLMEKEK